MSLPRFFAPEARPGDLLELAPEEAHHLRDVLRIREGERVFLLNGKGQEFEAEVVKAGREGVWVLPTRLSRSEPEPAFRLEILIPLLKGGRTEFLVEKATELGVSRIFPFVSRRAVARPSPRTLERLYRRSIQALKQCGRLWLPLLEAPAPLEELLPKTRASGRFFAYEKGGAPLHRAFEPPPGDLALAVGPEGGFSPEEAALLEAFDFLPLTLGPYILRAETAALFLMSIWRYHSLIREDLRT